ncbi:hypothetical protein MKW98_016079 [Papaver atlanticum]|uniref:Uncharacterized protein n=1 Tax=Papaver atlanticum TaxID=357466 RepID=A0AAD4XR09_9MAGN|nr:hypothetical protein MKW98_016079 [Papaver atlanticum]
MELLFVVNKYESRSEDGLFLALSQEPMSNNDTKGIGGSPFLQVVHSTATISDATRNLANLLYEINGGNNGLHMYVVMKGENESMCGGFPTFGRTNCTNEHLKDGTGGHNCKQL